MVRRAGLAAALGACFAMGVAIDAAAQTSPSQVSSGSGDRRELHVTAYRGYPPFAFVREVRAAASRDTDAAAAAASAAAVVEAEP